MQLMGFLAQGIHNRPFIFGEDYLRLWLEVEAGDEVGEAGEAVAEGGLMVKVMVAMSPERNLKSGQKWVRMNDVLALPAFKQRRCLRSTTVLLIFGIEP